MTTTLNALRALLPLAEQETAVRRALAQAAHDAGKPDVVCQHFATSAEAATSAITAARLALADADHVTAHARYRVTLRAAFVGGLGAPHAVEVLAEDVEDAQARAIAACEAAGLIHGNVISIARV